MSSNSISAAELDIPENIPTAIIYSIPDLSEYIVEIHHQQQSHFIGKEQTPERFGNLDSAKQAARKHKAEQGYLALSNTYAETEVSNAPVATGKDRFEYMAVEL